VALANEGCQASGLRYHDLRHSFVTKHLGAGTPEHTLMAIVGHITREMLEHYSHIRIKAKQEAVEHIQVKVPVTQTQAAKTVQ